MLNFFRKYQKYFFVFIAGMVIFSFVFFAAFGAIQQTQADGREDRVVGKSINGSDLRLLEISALSRFISADREDVAGGSSVNLLNDGVVRNDLVGSGIAELIVGKSFDLLREDISQKIQRVKSYRPYEHPDAQFVSAKAVWQRFAPEINREWSELQAKEVIDTESFRRLARLYQLQNTLPAEYLRRILMMHEQQYKQWLKPDPHLRQGDMSLFGFHCLSDWFGRNFIDLMAEFIHNASIVAEEKGHRVSLEEARGDIKRIYAETTQKLKEAKWKGLISFKDQLRILGMDEIEAAKVWRKVLLFRRYFQDIGQSVFLDRLAYTEFSSVANEKAVVELYQWPESLKLDKDSDLIALQTYMDAVGKKSKEAVVGFPSTFLSVAELEKKAPELVGTRYKAKIFAIDKREVGLRAPIKEVWDYETAHWEQLGKEFPFLTAVKSKEDRFKALEQLNAGQRAKIDLFARRKLVDQHPEWIKECLDIAEGKETQFALSNGKVRLPHISDEAKLGALFQQIPTHPETAIAALFQFESGEGVVRFENIEKISDPSIKTFQEALADGSLQPPSNAKEGDVSGKLKTMLEVVANRARVDLMKNPEDPNWIAQPTDSPLTAQFKLLRSEKLVTRTTADPWMKNEPFLFEPNQWSDVHIAQDGNVAFFCLKSREIPEISVSDQMAIGKDLLVADAQRLLSEKIYTMMQNSDAIVIPLQTE